MSTKLIVGFLILLTLTMVISPVYGLMTKEKLNEMLETRGKLIGKPYVPPTQPPLRLDEMTHEQKLAWLSNSNYTSPEEQIEKFIANANVTEYQTYEEAWLEIVNEHYGTNYTSYEGASLGLMEKGFEILENPQPYYTWPPVPYVPMPLQ